MNLKQLSEQLGLSQTTVSRALNGYPEVSESTRRRVVDAAQRFGYRPNPGARMLATGRTMAIGHVIPSTTRHEVVNPIFADFIAGASEIYAKAGYDMRLTVVDAADEEQAYRRIAAKGTVDGIIVHTPWPEDPRIPLLQQIGLPFVIHGRTLTPADDEVHWVDVNNARAFARATELLLDFGHRRIALINGQEFMGFAIRRRAGFEKAMAERGLTPDPRHFAAAEMTEMTGYSAAARMLDAEGAPTAFLVASMLMAIGVRRAIHERGLELGRDISVVIFDDDLSYLRNGTEVPLFTATRSSVRQAGRECAALLLDIVANPDQPPRHILLEAELLLGASTGPAPA